MKDQVLEFLFGVVYYDRNVYDKSCKFLDPELAFDIDPMILGYPVHGML